MKIDAVSDITTKRVLETLMLQWNVTEEDFQRHSQELMDDGLLKNKK